MLNFVKPSGLLAIAAGVVLITVSSMSGAAGAGWFSTDVGDLPTQESTGYRVEALGRDVRVYEFPAATADNVFCVMAFGDAGPVGLSCVVLPE